MSGSPSMPDIPNRGFNGKLLHSSQLKEKIVSEIIDTKASVLVLGAGKSGCDMIQAFQIAGYENVNWLCRETYWFWRHAAMFHDRSILGMLRAVCCLLFVFCALFSPSFCMFGLWLIGYIILPGSPGWPKHFNGAKFHFGVLCDRQLSFIKKVQPVMGDPDHFCKNGVVLKSGETVDCDVIVCATGYDTGFAALQCYKDGKAISVKDCPLYEHAIVPCFPCLISATTAFYHLRPNPGGHLGGIRCVLSEEGTAQRRDNATSGKRQPLQANIHDMHYFYQCDNLGPAVAPPFHRLVASRCDIIVRLP
ncbi:FMO1 [Symbiodinium sp. CCMP2456]|nr:FMO1 [Symbiodinium sp. CCMP2456]